MKKHMHEKLEAIKQAIQILHQAGADTSNLTLKERKILRSFRADYKCE